MLEHLKTYSFYYIFGLVFFVSLLISHFYFFFIKPPLAKGWKVVDSVWLLASFVGMIVLVSNNNQLLRIDNREIYSRQMDFHNKILFELLSDDISNNCFGRNERPADLKPTNRCEWAKILKYELAKLSYGKELDNTFLSLINNEKNTDRSHLQIKHNAIQYNTSQAHYSKINNIINRSSEETGFQLFLPAFLAILLALRVCKATADIISEGAKKDNKRYLLKLHGNWPIFRTNVLTEPREYSWTCHWPFLRINALPKNKKPNK